MNVMVHGFYYSELQRMDLEEESFIINVMENGIHSVSYCQEGNVFGGYTSKQFDKDRTDDWSTEKYEDDPYAFIYRIRSKIMGKEQFSTMIPDIYHGEIVETPCLSQHMMVKIQNRSQDGSVMIRLRSMIYLKAHQTVTQQTIFQKR